MKIGLKNTLCLGMMTVYLMICGSFALRFALSGDAEVLVLGLFIFGTVVAMLGFFVYDFGIGTVKGGEKTCERSQS